MPKPKRINKSKKQILSETERILEISHKRDLVINKFFPALIKASVSVDEAKALIQAMVALLMENVLKTMKERKLAEISDAMIEVLCSDGERKEEVTALLDTLNGESLYVAREIIEGMTHAIDATVTEELKNRNLGTLKPEWEKYLNK